MLTSMDIGHSTLLLFLLLLLLSLLSVKEDQYLITCNLFWFDFKTWIAYLLKWRMLE